MHGAGRAHRESVRLTGVVCENPAHRGLRGLAVVDLERRSTPHWTGWVASFCAFSQTALTNPGLPAESQTANRTHDFPVASNGIEKCLLPKAGRSVAEMI